MKQLPYFFALFLIVFVGFYPRSSKAASDFPHSAGLQVGQAWPAGDIGRDVDGAIVPGIFYEYAASDVFSLLANAYKSSHSDGRLKLTSTSIGIKGNLVYYDKLSPYATVGMGLYFLRKTVGAAQENAEKTLFGINLGLGADLDLSERFFIGMLFTIHNVFSGAVNLPVNGRTELSGRWSGFLLRGGFRF